MSKETTEILEALDALNRQIEGLIKHFQKYKTPAVAEESPILVTIETVRAVLAQKAQDGKQPAVKELITKYGAAKLTELSPDCFGQLLKEAEEL